MRNIRTKKLRISYISIYYIIKNGKEMKFLIIALLTLSLSTANSQDYWEKLELPSNWPVQDLKIDEDGSIYTFGIGLYKMDSDGNWHSKNHLKATLGGIEFDGNINEIGMLLSGLVELDNELFTMLSEGLLLKSIDDGENWLVITDDIRRPHILTKYNNIAYIVTRNGIYKTTPNRDTVEAVYEVEDESPSVSKSFRNGNSIILQHDKYVNNGYQYTIDIFDLESEVIVDSVRLYSFDLSGDYYEYGDMAYVLTDDSLFVIDRPLRSGSEPVITEYDLKEFLTPERIEKYQVYFGEMKTFDNGKLLIPNRASGDFIIADAGFKNPKLHNLGYGENWMVNNIYTQDDDYLLCMGVGLFRAKDKNFDDLESISLEMGNGIYDNIFETDDGYQATLSNLFFEANDSKLEVIGSSEAKLFRWGKALWYRDEDTMAITKDFGATWSIFVIEEKQFDGESKDLGNGIFSIIGVDSLYFIQYDDLSVRTIIKPEFEELYSDVSNIIIENEEVFALTSEGTFKYGSNEGWTKLATYDYEDDIYSPYSGYRDMFFEMINGVMIGFTYRDIIYSTDFGQTINEYNLGVSNNSSQKYIRLGDKFYFFGNDQSDPFYDFYELHLDEQKQFVSTKLSDDNASPIFISYTPTKDGRLIVCNLRGVYKSKDQLVSSVELDSDAIANELVIYPNISDSQITVVIDGIGNSELMIYDLRGNKQNVVINSISAGNTILNISNLAEGMYIVSKGSQSGFFFKK